MRKKEFIWILVLLVLGGVYIRYFSHWLDKRQIGITVSVRPSRRPGETVYPVFFTLNNAYKLTKLKVLPMPDNQFNPNALPVWNLISDSNSVPIRAFRYGQPIRGMKPAFEGAEPEDLQTNIMYRLLVSAGKVKGQHDFEIQ